MEAARPNSTHALTQEVSGERVERGSHTRISTGDVSLELLHAAQRGDRDALTSFVRHYERAVFAFLSRSTGRGPHVEDLAQEVFLRVFRALPQFEKREAKISTWIFQIAVRLVQDRRRRKQPTLVEVTEALRDVAQSPEEAVASRRRLSRVEALAEQLPEEQRMALILFEFHGLPLEEIATATGSRVATVKTRIFRARKFLREGLAVTSEERES